MSPCSRSTEDVAQSELISDLKKEIERILLLYIANTRVVALLLNALRQTSSSCISPSSPPVARFYLSVISLPLSGVERKTRMERKMNVYNNK
jgi:hypothetical protein